MTCFTATMKVLYSVKLRHNRDVTINTVPVLISILNDR